MTYNINYKFQLKNILYFVRKGAKNIPKIVLFKSIKNSKRRNKGNFTSKSN